MKQWWCLLILPYEIAEQSGQSWENWTLVHRSTYPPTQCSSKLFQFLSMLMVKWRLLMTISHWLTLLCKRVLNQNLLIGTQHISVWTRQFSSLLNWSCACALFPVHLSFTQDMPSWARGMDCNEFWPRANFFCWRNYPTQSFCWEHSFQPSTGKALSFLQNLIL